MVYGIVVAGGQGTRIGFQKQYAILLGKPVWEHSVMALLQADVRRVWLVVPQDDVVNLQTELEVKGLASRVLVVAGGGTRFESVRCGLSGMLASISHLEEHSETTEEIYVAVHDAARPFVLPSDVQAVIQSAIRTGGAILGAKVPDTVKSVVNGRIDSTIPRERVWLAQTPQVFRLEWFSAHYFSQGFTDATDDASVFEQLGYPVEVVSGTGENRKITTQSDWEYAQWFADRRWGEERQ